MPRSVEKHRGGKNNNEYMERGQTPLLLRFRQRGEKRGDYRTEALGAANKPW